MKVHAAVVVLLARGIEIKFRQRNLSRVPRSQIEKRRADDGIIADLKLASIFEHEHGWLGRVGISDGDAGSLFGMRCGNVSYGRNVRSGPGTAAVKNGGAPLIIFFWSGVHFATGPGVVNSVGYRNSINQRKSGLMISTMTRMVIGIAASAGSQKSDA